MLKQNVYKIFLIVILLSIILQQFLIVKVYAVPVDEDGNEIQEEIDSNEDITNIDDDNLSDDVDDDTGTMLQPIANLINVIGDSIISILTKCMLGTNHEKVMVKWEKLDTSNVEQANTTKTFSQDEIDEFKDSKGRMLSLKYPQFKYTPEEIFKGEIDLFSIDFISGTTVKNGDISDNTSEGWNALRGAVASWYKTLRYIAVVGLLSILIYLGIMIIFSSSAGKKADYKSSLMNWVIAMLMLFSMHYIMAFVIIIIQKFTILLGKSIGTIKVVFGTDKVFVTNFMGLARFQAQQYSLRKQVMYIVVYASFISLTFKFTFIYFKRMLNMAMLTIFAPLIAMMYPLDKKGSGKSRIFGFWLREYVYNALLQPMHLLLYDILIGSAVQISVNNPVYAIVTLFFLAQAEKMFKKIFGFGRAGGGMVGGLAGTVGAVTMASSLMNSAKGIRNAIFQSNNVNQSLNSSNKVDSAEDPFAEERRQEELFERRYGGVRDREGQRNSNSDSNPLDIDKSIFDARGNLKDGDFKNTQKHFKGFDNAFNVLKTKGMRKGKNQTWTSETREMFRQLEHTIDTNEKKFLESNLPFQYNDKFSKLNSNQLLEKLKECLKNGDMEGAQKYFDILRRRMLENKYMETHGGPRAFVKGRLSNLTDTDLQTKYAEAKASGNKGEILECEAEMALRAKDYTTYVEKCDEFDKFRLGMGDSTRLNENRQRTNNENARNGESQNTRENENEGRNESRLRNGIEKPNAQGTNQDDENLHKDDNETLGQEIGGASTTIDVENTSNPFVKLFRKSPNKSVRSMNADKLAASVKKNNVHSNVNYNLNNTENDSESDTENNFEDEENNNKSNIFSRTARRTISGVGNVVHEGIKPVWNTRKSVGSNLLNLGGKVAKGAVQTTIGVTSAAVQGGISISDGKYSAKEAAASFTGGFIAGGKIANKGEKFVKGVLRDIDYGQSEDARKSRIAKEWAERDDVKKYYKETYGRNSNKMVSIAQNYLVKEGIRDTAEQQKIIRYANYLREHQKLDTTEKSYKQAIEVFKFRRSLNSTYGIPSGEKARKEFIDKMAEENGSTKNKKEVKIHYADMLKGIDDFEMVEDNQEYDFYDDKR